MDWLWLIIGGVASAGTLWAATRAALGTGRADWLAAGRALGLQTVVARGHTWLLDGEVDGWQARAERLSLDEGHRTRVIVRPGSGGRLSAEIAFAAEPSALQRLAVAPDLAVGDPAFDDAVRVSPNAHTLTVALLDAATRKRLRTLTALGVRVEGGEIILRGPAPATLAADLEARLRAMVQLAKGLDLSELGVEARLARNARRDPLPAVRALNLSLLLAHHADHPLTAPTARSALTDDDAAVRLQAALHLGADGHPTLGRLVNDGAAPAALRVQALQRLAASAGGEWVDALLINHAGADSPAALRAEVAHHAARRRLAPALLSLCHQPAGLPAEPLARATAALGAVGPDAEPTLLALVTHPEPTVQRAAIDVLGHVGGAPSAGLLRRVVGGRGPAALKDAAEAALARLAERLPTTPGGLSLVAAEAGALSAVPVAATPQAAGALAALREGSQGQRAQRDPPGGSRAADPAPPTPEG